MTIYTLLVEGEKLTIKYSSIPVSKSKYDFSGLERKEMVLLTFSRHSSLCQQKQQQLCLLLFFQINT